MRHSAVSKAKHHFLVDIPIIECLKPIEEEKLKSGSGTKLLITLGPSCHEVETLVQMLEAGVTCARVDLTWGTFDFHRRSMANLAAAMRQTRRLCSVWLDTMGREMVVRRKFETDSKGWPLHGSSFRAEEGQTITITTDTSVEASSTMYPINYPAFPSMVQPGQLLQVGRYLSTGADGGSLYLKVVDTTGTTVVCEAVNSATLDGLLTVMVCHRNSGGVDSAADLELPLLTEYDVDCIKKLGQEYELDYISLSYCNSARDVYECRALLDSLHLTQTKIVAKIERKAGIVNFSGIAEAADGVILSRGNLGLDFDPEIMAILQKQVITKCNHMGKPIILTRIVDTMVKAPRPTRAEATDVANAVLDGADGLMLGAETLRGQYPVLTAETVLKLAASAEERFDYREHHEALVTQQFDDHPAAFIRGSSGDLHSPDMYGLSPTAQWGGAYHFAPNPDSHNGSGHMSYTASSAYLGHPPLPPTLSSEGDLQSSHQGMNGNGVAADGGAAFQPSNKYTSSFGNLNLLAGMRRSESAEVLRRARAGMAQVLKLESIASSAVRTAEKINAGLILVMTQTGRTASLVAKYRPPMPILAVVVPTLKSDGLGWRVEGKFLARQCLIIRGVVPMLAAPMSEGDEDLLNEAIFLATSQKLCAPRDYVVCIQSSKGALTFKVVQVNDQGSGIRTMFQGNSLCCNEEPDIVSDTSPFESIDYRGWNGGRRFSRGLSFRGAGALGAPPGRSMIPTASDAHSVVREGSAQVGGLQAQSSLDFGK